MGGYQRRNSSILAGRIAWPRESPNATLNIRDGGHFMAHLHYCEIFEALTS